MNKTKNHSSCSHGWYPQINHGFVRLLNNNNNSLHLYSPFLGTQSALHRRGGSPRPSPMCSIHLDDATAAILRQNAHHKPACWCKGDRVMKPISVWGWLVGHVSQRPMGEIFNHRESGPRFNVSSERQCFFDRIVSPSLHWGIRTHRDRRVSTPCWPH